MNSMKQMIQAFVFIAGALTSVVGHAQQIEKVPLADMGGQVVALYGLADYKLAATALKAQSQGLVPVPLDEKGRPVLTADGRLDFERGKFAMLGLVRYQAKYAFMSMDPMEALTNPQGFVQPRIMPQFFVSHVIVNPTAFVPAYKIDPSNPSSAADPRYNPDLASLLFNHLLTSDKEFAAKGRAIWTNPWEVARAGRFHIDADLDEPGRTRARGAFKDASGKLLVDLKMGRSASKPAQLTYRNYKLNAIATSQVETTVYPIAALDEMIQREFDPAVDSYELGGELKIYLEGMKFVPTLWQTSTNFKSLVYLNYVTGR